MRKNYPRKKTIPSYPRVLAHEVCRYGRTAAPSDDGTRLIAEPGIFDVGGRTTAPYNDGTRLVTEPGFFDVGGRSTAPSDDGTRLVTEPGIFDDVGWARIVAAHFVCQYVPMMTVLFGRTHYIFLIIGMYHNLSPRSEHPCD